LSIEIVDAQKQIAAQMLAERLSEQKIVNVADV